MFLYPNTREIWGLDMTNEKIKSNKSTLGAIALIAGAILVQPQLSVSAFAASKIIASVDNIAITNNDLSRRAALLRLQKRKGNINKQAKQALIDEALKLKEAQRRNVNVPQSAVDNAYAKFARGNKMKTSQLTQVLNRAGVGSRGFKDFIKAQIAWQAVVSSRVKAGGAPGRSAGRSMNDRLFASSNGAASAEYVLDQVIFFSSGSRSKNASVSEAKTMRSAFVGCEKLKTQASNFKNVGVRTLGRVPENGIPAAWKQHVVGLEQGQTSAVRSTERGAEYLAVCSKTSTGKQQSGAAEAGFDLKVQGGKKAEDIAAEYLEELRKKAVIR